MVGHPVEDARSRQSIPFQLLLEFDRHHFPDLLFPRAPGKSPKQP
jgi:hypothetical protein